ncbi:MAG: sugar ABC transporter substrate-binding protein, partial [Ornithinimicrobium sp.]
PLVLASCATGGDAGSDPGTLRIATVDNRDLLRLEELSARFTADNPEITLEWVTLDENILRQRVMMDIATGQEQFDVVTVGTYEVPIWAERDWLLELDGFSDTEDLLPSIREALSVDGTLLAAPFYGESSFTMYRTDLFAEAGLEMPDQPTWEFLSEAAATISQSSEGVYGICLRGKPGWGENIGLITAMANSYGARWFDEDFQPQLDSEAWSSTVTDYYSMLNDYGPPEAATLGYTENLALFQEGQCGIWVDATVAASALTDPEESSVAGDVGFAAAPGTGLDKQSNWLWSWALAVPADSANAEAAKAFVTWATSPEYVELVAAEDGWANVPPGTRTSLYENQEYLDAAPFAQLTLASIEAADPQDPTVDPVPYVGIQYVSIPSFPAIGDAVGNRIAEGLDGSISAEQALEDSQWVTEKVITQAEFADKE